MKRMLIMIASVWLCVGIYAQSDHDTETIRKVLGLLSIEEADSGDVGLLEDILRDPVELNQYGISRLESGGLLSPYQSASLKDYISRHGTLFSLTELAAIDGFNPEYAEALASFLSFQCDDRLSLSGSPHGRAKGSADMKTSLKLSQTEPSRWNYGFRGKICVADRFEVVVSASRSYDAPHPYPSSCSVALTYFHRHGKVVFGDFNARFGQGLCLWNTSTFSSLTSPSSFMKRASGISGAYSYTGDYAMTGMASDFSSGPWKISAAVALPGIKSGFSGKVTLTPALNIGRSFSFGHISTTHFLSISDVFSPRYRIPQMKSSIDACLCFSGVNLFSEFLFDWVMEGPSFTAGVECGAGDGLVLASLLRYIPASSEHGLAVSGEFSAKKHTGVFSADLMYDSRQSPSVRRIQLKGQFRWRWSLSEFLYSELRLNERFRTWGAAFRTDIRSDICYDSETWLGTLRLNALACKGVAVLGYAEGGYKAKKLLKIYFRLGLFRIDDWEDRIYVYERDAIGNFNVPAFYGRGCWTSLYVTSRFARWGSVSLRASYTAYPFMREKKKPGKAELRLQFSLFL